MDLLLSTAYHAQTNGQLEQSNQTAEIALHYLLPDLDFKEQWPKELRQLQAIINNLQNFKSTKLSPNKIIYEFQTKESIDLFSHNEQEIVPDTKKKYQPMRI